MAKRELRLIEGSSRKFWTITLKGDTHTVVYGRIGTDGRTLTKSFATRAKAKESYDKLIQSKLKKGYTDAPTGKKRAAKKTKAASQARVTKKSAKKRVAASHDYGDVVEFLRRVEDPKDATNERTPITAAEARKLRKQHPGVPQEFIDYLRVIGPGLFRESQFVVQDYLAPPEDILGEGAIEWDDPELPLLCFGDNLSGDLSGFLPTEDWMVADLWHDSGTIYRTNKRFPEYIREQMLMGEDGSDRRVKRTREA